MDPFVKTSLWAFYSLGGTIAATLTIFVGGGAWLDKNFSSFPVFLLGGIIICLSLIVFEIKVILKRIKEDR